MTPITSLRGREFEADTLRLLAIAQVHRPEHERAARAPAIAQGYADGTAGDLWGWEEDGAILALAGVQLRGELLHLGDLAVAPERRRSGLGRQLVEFLRERHAGREIEGDTLEAVRHFYEACGFEVTTTPRTVPGGEPVLRFRLPPSGTPSAGAAYGTHTAVPGNAPDHANQ